MKKIFEQFLKFGLVGIICFFIDFIIYNIFNYLGFNYLISGLIGFVTSVIFNYILSMKFVFKHNDNMSRQKELTIFIILSVIGLIINELILYLLIDMIYPKWNLISNIFNLDLWKIISKLFSTGVVMVYNFISRKIFIEGKSS